MELEKDTSFQFGELSESFVKEGKTRFRPGITNF